MDTIQSSGHKGDIPKMRAFSKLEKNGYVSYLSGRKHVTIPIKIKGLRRSELRDIITNYREVLDGMIEDNKANIVTYSELQKIYSKTITVNDHNSAIEKKEMI